LKVLIKSESKKGAALRLGPDLSMAFPAGDVAAISELPADRGYKITTTFMGLYGVSSPLPNYYTEDLYVEYREEGAATRDFYDIIHQRVLSLFADCWGKYRIFDRLEQGPYYSPLDMLFAAAGLMTPDLIWLRYAGMMGGHPRSALGLQTLVADYIGEPNVEIVPCIARVVSIPADQRLQLGTSGAVLGETCFLGCEILDHQGKFRVRVGPLSEEKFHALLPGERDHQALAEAVRQYLHDPLDYDVELVLASAEVKPVRLGNALWSRLGYDTVLDGRKSKENFGIVFSAR
jgi:type VI secretion system protein ImpH